MSNSGTGTAENASPSDLPERALELALSDPARALRLAEEAATAAVTSRDRVGRSRAEQARGLALRSLERPRESVRALQRAVGIARGAGEAVQAARAEVSLALSLGHLGRNRQALRVLERAGDVLAGPELVRLRVQRAVVVMRLGDAAAVVAALPPVLVELRRTGDRLWEARAWSTLGIAHVQLNDFGTAEAALRRSEELFADLGQRADAAGNRHNRGWCAGLSGDVPLALRHYGESERQFEALGLPVAELQLDRARLLASVGLFRQGRVVAQQALGRLSRRQAPVAHAEALLVAAEVSLLDGDVAATQRYADDAIEVLRRQHRPGRLAVARLIRLRGRWAAGDRGPALSRAARRVAAQLEAAGLRADAADAHLLAGRAALLHGDRAAGTAELARVAAGRYRGTAGHRARAWLAEALRRNANQDTGGAARALRAGLRAVDLHRAGLGALELRTRTAGYAADLADLGRRLALDSGRADQLLRWTEYGRATALRLPPIRPPEDPELAADLAELRRLSTDVDAGPGELRRRERVQARIEQRTRERPGATGPTTLQLPSLGDLVAALRHRCLVSLVVVGEDMRAVTVSGGRLAVGHLGPMAEIERELRFALAALRRAVQPGRPARLAADAHRALADAGTRLGALLLDPLPAVSEAAELVISPPARLGAVPWATLPAVRRRPTTVVPSANAWFDAVGRPAGTGHVVLVAGPGLEHAEDEIADVACMHPGAVTLTGGSATVPAVCAALDGSRLAHIAAHGEVDPQNPMFSAVRLADGPLMTYDLEQLRCPPATVLLSACDSLSATASGEELLSMALALLHLGSRTVLGSVAPLPDRAARPIMRELHHQMAGGQPPAAALHRTQAVAFDAEPEVAAAASCLLCVGAG